MSMEDRKIGFAMCGSFCTFSKVLPVVKSLTEMGANVFPLMSEMAYSTDTRFGKAEDFRDFLKVTTGNDIICTVKDAEPIGPKAYLDALVIAPCTGNTLAKIANGITDSAVTMAAKANLRNKRPLIIAVSTNDGLGANLRNIGMLMPKENIYFVPFGQDDYRGKPDSLISDMSEIIPALEAAFDSRQLQPVLYAHKKSACR